jgi:hypothetical protein
MFPRSAWSCLPVVVTCGDAPPVDHSLNYVGRSALAVRGCALPRCSHGIFRSRSERQTPKKQSARTVTLLDAHAGRAKGPKVLILKCSRLKRLEKQVGANTISLSIRSKRRCPPEVGSLRNCSG